MANLTIAQLRKRVRRELNESAENQWDEDELNDNLDMATEHVYTLVRRHVPSLLLATTNISFLADTELYALPADFGRLIQVEDLQASTQPIVMGAVPITEKWRYYSGAGNLDYAYYMMGSKLGIVPIPSEAVANAIRIYYETVFAGYISGSAHDESATSGLPQEFDLVISDMAASLSWARLDGGKARFYANRSETYGNRYLMDLNRRMPTTGNLVHKE